MVTSNENSIACHSHHEVNSIPMEVHIHVGVTMSHIDTREATLSRSK